jgi:predicted nucleotidyltransferase
MLHEDIKTIISGAAFDGCFSKEQLEFVTHTVAQEAKTVLGDKLQEVILFGSYARGDQRDWSDVDIMFLLNEDDQLLVQNMCCQVSDALTDLEFEMGAMLSTIAVPYSRFMYMKEHYPFYNNVDKEGVRIYA